MTFIAIVKMNEPDYFLSKGFFENVNGYKGQEERGTRFVQAMEESIPNYFLACLRMNA